MDAAVAGALLDALTPEQVALALAAASEVTGQHQRASRAAELAVERARYDADRAERAFSQVEPENRLVARTLEAHWEARLAALAGTTRPWSPPAPRCRRSPDRDSLARISPLTCRPSGTPRPRLLATASGCCAP